MSAEILRGRELCLQSTERQAMWRCQIHHKSVVIRDGQPALVDVLKSSLATFWSWVWVTSFPLTFGCCRSTGWRAPSRC